jgi:hypothetical protein
VAPVLQAHPLPAKKRFMELVLKIPWLQQRVFKQFLFNMAQPNLSFRLPGETVFFP